MLPYFGRHSGKILVNFGYRLWILASHSEYPFHMILYSGKENDTSTGELLGTRVIDGLLQPIREPLCHTETFFNLCTSYDVLVKLQDIKGLLLLERSDIIVCMVLLCPLQAVVRKHNGDLTNTAAMEGW